MSQTSELEPTGAGPLVGLAVIREAVALLRRERSLWLLALVPVVFTVLALAVAFGLVGSFAGEILELLRGWIPDPAAERWFEWLWVAPLWLLAWLARALGFVFALGAAVLASWLVASVLAAPFLDVLSERVEGLCGDAVREASGAAALWRGALRSAWAEAQRVGFFLALWGVIWLVALFIPVLAPPAFILLACFLLPLDYTGYAFDRRGIGFAGRRRWLRRHARGVVGFGAAALAAGVVPGLNLLMLPVLVTAGTLLVLRHPPVSPELPGPLAPSN